MALNLKQIFSITLLPVLILHTTMSTRTWLQSCGTRKLNVVCGFYSLYVSTRSNMMNKKNEKKMNTFFLKPLHRVQQKFSQKRKKRKDTKKGVKKLSTSPTIVSYCFENGFAFKGFRSHDPYFIQKMEKKYWKNSQKINLQPL